MDLKNCVVMASGKMRQCAYDKLNSEVHLLGWQQGGRMPKEQFDAWLAEAEALFSTGNIRIDEKLLAKAPKLKVIAQASVDRKSVV